MSGVSEALDGRARYSTYTDADGATWGDLDASSGRLSPADLREVAAWLLQAADTLERAQGIEPGARFTLEVDMINDAFVPDPTSELGGILADVALRVADGSPSGVVRDSNGATVGRFDVIGREAIP